ncbi:MlaD family protein [Gilvimarinus sp. F26214L]|uniref:MlaD family protein n=1 Tax=Gilvimarinus sp. DZF01 TaxID=3461371 RepID=UPI004045BAFC
METRAHHVIIGLFVVVAVVSGLLFALWLAKPAADEDYQYFIIGFTRPVSGLSVGSRVEYSGIPVGDVVDLSLNPDDPRRVRALIRVYADTPVNEDTKADLGLANISGAMKIQLSGGTPESSRIEGDSRNPPLIVAEPSSFGAVLESGEGLIISISELLESANQLLSDRNIERIANTLDHLEESTRVIAEQSGDIAQLSRKAETAMDEIILLARNTDASLNHERRGLLTRAGEATRDLQQASERLDTLLQDNQGAVDSGLQGLSDLGPALEELRGTLGNLNRISRRLEENPSGFLFRREEVEEFEP